MREVSLLPWFFAVGRICKENGLWLVGLSLFFDGVKFVGGAV